jgi:hypothetical protein
MQVGDVTIFDNRRMLHGRTAFTSDRHLRTAYVERDSIHLNVRFGGGSRWHRRRRRAQVSRVRGVSSRKVGAEGVEPESLEALVAAEPRSGTMTLSRFPDRLELD